MKKDTVWYAWIPNLSGDIFLCDIRRALEESDFVGNGEDYYSRAIAISDISSKTYNFSLTVPGEFSCSRDKNELVVELKEVEAKVVCEIERNGLVKLSATFQEEGEANFYLGIVSAIYYEIRNIFHEHTHHDKEADRLLDVVRGENRDNAIATLVRQYERKIFDYHHYLKEYLSQPHFRTYLKQCVKGIIQWFNWKSVQVKQPSPVECVAQAEGEMLYALLFVNLFKEDLDAYEKYHFVFRNAFDSFNGIRNKISEWLQDYANKLMIGLTIILVILTVGLAISGFRSS